MKKMIVLLGLLFSSSSAFASLPEICNWLKSNGRVQEDSTIKAGLLVGSCRSGQEWIQVSSNSDEYQSNGSVYYSTWSKSQMIVTISNSSGVNIKISKTLKEMRSCTEDQYRSELARTPYEHSVETKDPNLMKIQFKVSPVFYDKSSTEVCEGEKDFGQNSHTDLEVHIEINLLHKNGFIFVRSELPAYNRLGSNFIP